MKFYSLIIVLIIFACFQTNFAQNKDGFALYLLPSNIRVEQLPKLDIKNLKPTGKPVFSAADIQFYLTDYHEISFQYQGADRLKNLKIPPEGLPFIVLVGDQPIYTGAFAGSKFRLQTSMIHIRVDDLGGDFPVLTIEGRQYAYTMTSAPDPPFADQRKDPRILQSLKDAGILYEKLWLAGKCLKIVPTGKHTATSLFTFSVTETHLGKFEQDRIEFEPDFQTGAKLLTALSAEFNDSSRLMDFDTDTIFRLKFVRQLTDQKPPIYYAGFEILPYRSIPNEKLTLPIPKSIVRVEIEPDSASLYKADELLKLLPRLVAIEGSYSEQTVFQRGTFVLKNGRSIKWAAADKNSLMIFGFCQNEPCGQLFKLP